MAIPASFFADVGDSLWGHKEESSSEDEGRVRDVAPASVALGGGKPVSEPDASTLFGHLTDFKESARVLDTGVDWVEKSSDKGGEELVESAKGIPVLEELAQGSAFMNHVLTQAGGGLVKGAGDLVGGAANAIFHPIDTAKGLAGMLEHSGLPGVGSLMKSAHGLYDLAVNGGGEYGSSVGDLANHVLDPFQSGEDDQKAQTKMVTGILAPGELDKKPGEKGVGWDVWKDKPTEAVVRAAANIVPMLMGGEEPAAPEKLPPGPDTLPGLGPAEPVRKSQQLTGDAPSEAVDSQPMNSERERLLNERKSTPTPSPDELLDGLRDRPVEAPVRPSPSEPSIDELLKRLPR